MKEIIINSKHRVAGTASDCRINLPSFNCKKYRVKNVQIFNNSYVSDGSNISFTVTEADTDTSSISLTAGSYGGTSLAEELEDLLNNDTSLDGVYTVTYSQTTSKLTIACTEDIALSSFSSKAQKVLGFTGDQSSAASHESDVPILVDPNPHFLVFLDEFPAYEVNISSSLSRAFTECVPNDTNAFGVISYSPQSDTFYEFHDERSFKRVRLQVFDQDGETVDFQSGEVIVIMEVE